MKKCLDGEFPKLPLKNEEGEEGRLFFSFISSTDLEDSFKR